MICDRSSSWKPKPATGSSPDPRSVERTWLQAFGGRAWERERVGRERQARALRIAVHADHQRPHHIHWLKGLAHRAGVVIVTIGAGTNERQSADIALN